MYPVPMVLGGYFEGLVRRYVKGGPEESRSKSITKVTRTKLPSFSAKEGLNREKVFMGSKGFTFQDPVPIHGHKDLFQRAKQFLLLHEGEMRPIFLFIARRTALEILRLEAGNQEPQGATRRRGVAYPPKFFVI
jgi:hypothetical protein